MKFIALIIESSLQYPIYALMMIKNSFLIAKVRKSVLSLANIILTIFTTDFT